MTDTMPSANSILEAIQCVNDQESFIQRLLIDALGWSITEDAELIGDITYEWTEEELQASGLSDRILDGKIYQIVLPNNPWGIFILDFKNPDALTTGRGMTGVLRKVVAGLVEKKRGSRDPNLAWFKLEHLLFICNHNYERFRFAHFKAPPEGTSTAPMASFGWGPEDINAVRTICEFNLNALCWPTDEPTTSDGWIELWRQAFDVEKVTKRFYQDYSTVFNQAEKLIGQSTGFTGDELRLYTQTLFNRLMFLRFIERKGWLTFPGQQGTNYLSTLFEAGGFDGKSFFQGRLRPLFFEGLAIEGRQESEAYGRVPFLNGGLFEESDLDTRVQDIPDEVFHAVFGDESNRQIFYSYNFTVEESTPLDIEVAVDPEMLGKVFEELVTGRHESGSYYTPRPVVSFMCREALKGYLTSRTQAPADALSKLVDNHVVEGLNESHASTIVEALGDLKAVDPACGSGAYLLGLLQEIIAIRRTLQSEKLASDPQFLYDLKLHIISFNLYGVDIDPFATEIAKLRLWLSLAVEADEPVPLPNLDFKIETGDSLLGPNPQEMPDLFRQRLQLRADVLAVLKDKFLHANGLEKDDLKDSISREEAAIAEELEVQIGRGIVDWRIQFAEVFASGGGFEILLANPPYVDSEQMVKTDAAYRARISDNFVVTKGNWDLYIPFWQRCVDLLSGTGSATLITPNKWLSISYGAALRKYVGGLITWIADYTRFRAFANVGVFSIVASISRLGSDSIRVLHFADGHKLLGRITIPASTTAQYNNWGMLLSENLALVDRLIANCEKLAHYCDAEEAFTVSEAYELKDLLYENDDPTLTEFRFINTGTVDPFISLWGKKPTTYLKSKFLYPVIEREAFAKRFPRRLTQASSPKIIISGMRHFEGYLDAGGDWIAGKSTVVLRGFRNGLSPKTILAVVNASISKFFLKECYGALGMDGGINFTPSNVREIPIPRLDDHSQQLLDDLVTEILSNDEADQKRHSQLLTRVDAILYAAYSLSETEVAAIEAQVQKIRKRR